MSDNVDNIGQSRLIQLSAATKPLLQPKIHDEGLRRYRKSTWKTSQVMKKRAPTISDLHARHVRKIRVDLSTYESSMALVFARRCDLHTLEA